MCFTYTGTNLWHSRSCFTFLTGFMSYCILMEPQTVYRPPVYGYCGTSSWGGGRGFQNNLCPTTPGRATSPRDWFIYRKRKWVSWGWGKCRGLGRKCCRTLVSRFRNSLKIMILINVIEIICVITENKTCKEI